MEHVYQIGDSRAYISKVDTSMKIEIESDNGEIAKIIIPKGDVREFIGVLLHVQAQIFKSE